MGKWIAMILAAMVFSAASAARAETASSGHMPVAVVARAAYENSPALQSARAALKATQELYPQALANWHPDLGASAGVTASDVDNGNFGGGGTFTKDVSVSVTQALWRGGRSEAQKNEAVERINAQYAALRGTEQKVLSSALVAGLDVVFEKLNLDLQIRNEKLYHDLQGAVSRRRDAGETTDTEVHLASTRLARATADRLAAETTIDNAKTRFEEATGLLPAEWTGVRFMISTFPSSLAEAVDVANASNPDVQQAIFSASAEEKSIGRVRGELRPLVNLSASWQKEWDPQPGIVDDTQVMQAGIRATMPLYEGGAIRSRIRQAKHAAAERRLGAEDVRRQVERSIISEWRLMKVAAQKRAVHESEVLSAEAASRNLEAEVFAGEKTLTDLLEANQDWLDARASRLQSMREEQISVIRIAGLLGILTPENLGFGDAAYDEKKYVHAVRHRVLSESTEVK